MKLAKYLSIMSSIIYQSTWIWIFFNFLYYVARAYHIEICKSNWNWKNWKIVKIFILHKLHNWNVFFRCVYTIFYANGAVSINILHIAYVTFIVFIIFGFVWYAIQMKMENAFFENLKSMRVWNSYLLLLSSPFFLLSSENIIINIFLNTR